MLVVDAGVVVTALAADNVDGDAARARLRGEELAAPALLDVEVLSALRRLVGLGRLPERRARLALVDLVGLAALRVPHRDLLAGCWELRNNVTAYDGCYVVLAAQFGAPLLTGDARLGRAPDLPCEVEVLTTG